MTRRPVARPPRILFVWVGREGDSPLDESTADYVGRISKFLPTAIRRVRPEGGDGEAAVRAESGRLLEAVEEAGSVWLFDLQGKTTDSRGLARWLGTDLEGRPAPLALLVGGAAGVDDRVRSRADRVVALSAMTFPHALARLMAAEQLFRALTLREGLPYHK